MGVDRKWVLVSRAVPKGTRVTLGDLPEGHAFVTCLTGRYGIVVGKITSGHVGKGITVEVELDNGTHQLHPAVVVEAAL